MSFPSCLFGSLRLAAALTYALLLPFYALAQTAPTTHFSPVGGLFHGPLHVTLSSETPNTLLYYTLDGSEPGTNTTLYAGPLSIDSTTILRVRAFAPGFAHPPVVTHSYFIGLQHTFPVVSLAFPPPAFFDSLTGIYTNYTNGLSAVSNIEFFEPEDSTAVLNQLVEVDIQGTSSVIQAQKSLEIKAKKSLGKENLDYPMFPDLPYTNYKRLVLRNGGQDWCVMQFRDEFATSLVGDLSDLNGLLTPPHLFLQAWRPSVVYLNGQYWGIHNIRERMKQFYIRQHFDWEDDEYDLLENYHEVIIGDSVAWFQLVEFLQHNDFSSNAQWEELKQQIDYQNYLDYCVYNVYLENEDWPGNNVRRFKQHSPEGKWQWMTYDLDFTFGLYQSNGGWNTGDASPNTLGRLLDSTALAWPNPDWSTLLFRRCWQNATFRRDFANRMADMLNTNLAPARIYKRLEQFRARYEPEMAAHYHRWWGAYIPQIWLDNIAKTRSFAKQRPSYVRKEITTALPEATGLAILTADVSPRQAGSLIISTVHLDSAYFPWPGIYFKGVAVPVKAIARPGFRFLKWSDPSLGTTDSTNVLVENIHSLIAYFEPNHLTDTSITETSSTLEISLLLHPRTGVLTISNPSLADGGFQAQIVDALGRVVLAQLYSAQAEGTLSLEVGDLIPGTYFVRITLAGSGRTGTKGFGKTNN